MKRRIITKTISDPTIKTGKRQTPGISVGPHGKPNYRPRCNSVPIPMHLRRLTAHISGVVSLRISIAVRVLTGGAPGARRTVDLSGARRVQWLM